MTDLFKGKKATEVVSVSAIRALTGITAADFRFDGQDEPEQALDALLEQWVEETASNILVRLGRQVDPAGADSAGISGVLIRTVANIVATAHQQRSSPVIQLGDFAARVMNASDALDKLDAELEPFKNWSPPGDDDTQPSTRRVEVFWSSQPYEEPEGTS